MRFPILLIAALAALTARADEPPIIAKARAYIGSEETLNAVKSVHFVGKIVSTDPGDPSKQVTATVDIIFQRPWQHRIIVTTNKLIHTIGLDDYDVWDRLQDPADPRRSRVNILSVELIKSLRSDVWENLAYFRGIEATGGSLQDLGPATVDGVACDKVAFNHGPGLIYYRYFDTATGRLVYTETATGFQIREQGEIMVDGLRFPQGMVTKRKNAAGREQSTVYQFDKITVNETFPDSLFAVPPPQPQPAPTRPAVAPAAPTKP